LVEKKMNDSFSGKNGKVKVMYVRSDDDSNGDDRNKNKRPAGKGRPADGARSSGRTGQDKPRGNNDRRGSGSDSRRSESDRPRRPARTEDRGGYDSPCKTVSRGPEEEPAFDHGGISGKSFIDPEQLRRQRAEETRVYGENACQALFASRPDAIVRAWFVQSVTPRFREALRWMAANRKAYHVVDEEELAKASGTEHHGGVCFLIKKRQGLDAQTYLKEAPAKDCVLALEEVGNPHNLGAIVRILRTHWREWRSVAGSGIAGVGAAGSVPQKAAADTHQGVSAQMTYPVCAGYCPARPVTPYVTTLAIRHPIGTG
jgi:TrmH RNA methyltransferase